MTSTQAPVVSVIINCFNGARFLRETLESVRAQTFGDWELVFWDNQSTDGTASILKSFDDARFRYFLAPEHTNLAAAKKLAIAQARGEWLAFLDADDLWLEHKLASQIAAVGGGDPATGLVYGEMRVLVEPEAADGDLARSALAAQRANTGRIRPSGWILSALLKENFIAQPSMIIRRSVYEAAGGVDPNLRYAWDYDIALKAARLAPAIFVPGVNCVYRIHGGNLTQTQRALGFEETIELVSSYLPLPAARAGVKSYQSQYAGSEIRGGKLFAGLGRLMRHGDPLVFARMLVQYICRRIAA